jgi:putative DNA primase/helicase
VSTDGARAVALRSAEATLTLVTSTFGDGSAEVVEAQRHLDVMRSHAEDFEDSSLEAFFVAEALLADVERRAQARAGEPTIGVTTEPAREERPRQGRRGGNGHADAAPVADDITIPVDLTENALAHEFTRRHRDELRYIHEWGKWLRWDDARWDNERTLAVFDLARAIAQRIGEGARNDKLRARVEAASTVAAIVTLARADRAHARVTEDFDADPWLLNTPAGTVDLRAGEMHPHRREDGITKVTPVSPSDEAPALWFDCLKTWTRGDAELEGFLQRLAGYFCTGSVRDEVLPIVHGPGGNGKTKFVETLRACLGHDYVTGVAMETLIVTSGEQHPTDVADLRAMRLAIATETEEGRRLAESKVKQLTGGDRLRARYMRRDFFEFNPTHKLLIVGNHRPVLRNVDEAIKRRLLLIPFTAAIPADKRDPDLAVKLQAEYPAILGWMLAGCLEWQRQGLNPPSSVMAATADYFEAADVFGRWAEDCLVFDPNATMPKAAAFTSWKAWAEGNGEYVGTEARLRDYLTALPGVDEARLHRGRVWIGVGLRAAERAEP